MRHKTYLSPERQWDKTVDLFHSRWGPDAAAYGESYSWYLGQVIRPHPHLTVGDFCLFYIDHGCADRWRTWCFTSKGYAVHGLYVMYQRWKFERSFSDKTFADGSWKKRFDKAGICTCIELPSHLAGTQPDDAGVRAFVLSRKADASVIPHAGKRE